MTEPVNDPGRGGGLRVAGGVPPDVDELDEGTAGRAAR